ncbi:hypothetical protein GCM10007939_00240 [Amylibacter marinus]|uniref:Lipoprotein n=1 Tax=Amylibacter marinus TaxID=1475483 RepID=A0ABQ5VRE3_9RHOB|nr:hypothetical protein [Amylibacter marinus]GLQ33741.1 hypothetical protein GCM10007939_00240 [Amylibacter marinus]
MSLKFTALSCAIVVGLSGCVAIDPVFYNIKDKTVDTGIDSGPLSNMVAGIWVDPHGCDHWIIDDGVEGYLSARLNDNGKPVCSGVALPNNAIGPFKRGEPSRIDGR